MSFICDNCHKPTKDHVSCKKVVLQTRKKIYKQISSDKNGFVDINKTIGTEIVKELNLCPPCYKKRIKYEQHG